jgi:RNA polymerase sigma-70 factor, ECF subfamily
LFDLERCLERARGGEDVACRLLVEHLYPLAAKVVRAHLPRGASEDDWLQEVFLRLFARLDQYRGEAPLEHWFARLAVNVCLDLLRQQRRRPELRWTDLSPKEAELLRASLATSSDGDALTARELVAKLLDTLPAEDRVVITLLDLEQRSVADIARTLGRGESWVKVRAFRARQKLRDAVMRLGGDRDG